MYSTLFIGNVFSYQDYFVLLKIGSVKMYAVNLNEDFIYRDTQKI